MVSVKHGNAFSFETSPDHSDVEDDIEVLDGSSHAAPSVRNPLSSASRPGPDEVMVLLRQMQLESERSRQREQALLQQLAAAEQRPPAGSAPRSHMATISGVLVNPSIPATISATSAGPTGPSVPIAPASSRNANAALDQIPDSDPGKASYDKHARKMSMLVALFPTHEDFIRMLPDFDPTSTTRFASPENRARGHTADIYSVFPPVCHAGLRNSSRVQRAVIQLAGARRHQATHCIQASFHDIFADLPEGLRNAIRAKDWTYPQAAYMVQGNTSQWGALQLPPAYYPEGRAGQPKEVFRAPWLLRLARRILYSSTSLQSATQREPLQKTDGMKWNADITAGLIAMCCVLTRFAFGPDGSFTNIGDESKFDFAAAYLYIKEFILRALARGHKWAVALILFWRMHVLAPSTLARVLGDDQPQLVSPAALAEDEEHIRLLEEDFDGNFEDSLDGDDSNTFDIDGMDSHDGSDFFNEPQALTPHSSPPPASTRSLQIPSSAGFPSSSSVQPGTLGPVVTVPSTTSLRPFAQTTEERSTTSHNPAELEVLVGGVRRVIAVPPTSLAGVVTVPIGAVHCSLSGGAEGPEQDLVAQTIVRNGEVLHVFPHVSTLPCDQPEHCPGLIGVPQSAADTTSLPDIAITPDESTNADDMPALLPAEVPVPAKPVKPRPRGPKRVAVAQATTVVDHQDASPAQEPVGEDMASQEPLVQV